MTRVERKIQIPSVLVLLVVKNGASRLRECLQALAAQTYPRLGVLAVEDRSRDGSHGLLEQALGPGRVLGLDRDAGVAGSVRAALEQIPAAQEADYLLLLRDDTVLAEDAVHRLVEAASLEGVDRIGIVGPKIVDRDDPRILREVGRSTDRFGHPATPLQDGEVDHGQYDRVREVLFVSSSAMLVSRDAWERTGMLDERLDPHHEDLDFCWRARLAGFRVLMTPLATARRTGAAPGDGRAAGDRRSERYYAERAGLAAMLKNYGVLSLSWLLPLYAFLGTIRLAFLTLSRRFEDAYELLAAWGWNLRHLPGTLRRRVRAQAVRTVRDRDIRRFMGSATLRAPRWLEAAGEILTEQQELDVEQVAGIREHAASLARSHPVLVAWSVAAVVGALAIRRFLGPEVLQGGVLAAFPPDVQAFFGELASGVRTTEFGGPQAASPALAALGGLSWVFRSPALAQKVALAALVPIAGTMLYRSVLHRTEHRIAAVVAGAAYAVSAVVLWAFSEGRIGLLVALAVLPLIAERLEAAFERGGSRPWRVAVGAGVPLAIGFSFFPGICLAAAVLLLVHLVASPARLRGLLVAVAAAVWGGALVFPMLPELARGSGLASLVGPTTFADAARLVPGRARRWRPGSSPAQRSLRSASWAGRSAARLGGCSSPPPQGRRWRGPRRHAGCRSRSRTPRPTSRSRRWRRPPSSGSASGPSSSRWGGRRSGTGRWGLGS